ncbi:hypothetical protein [Microbacterium sp. PF5]|uniref:hypothetical protein n=1 Tax=Microbacterium sp. PF5 TaxID=2305435 RepID=UPI00109B7A94|nr:hypothetical protein [Microbacterium sp. PF5]
MAKYTARRPRGDRPVLVLGISDVVVIEGEPAVPVSTHHLSAWGRWVRDVAIPDAAAQRLHELAEHFDIVWASEWGHNAHTAFREPLELPEEPWPFLPVQFDKLAHIRRYADGLPWIWVDDPLVDLSGEPPRCDDGIVVRVDPAAGILSLDVDELLTKTRELVERRAEEDEENA